MTWNSEGFKSHMKTILHQIIICFCDGYINILFLHQESFSYFLAPSDYLLT